MTDPCSPIIYPLSRLNQQLTDVRQRLKEFLRLASRGVPTQPRSAHAKGGGGGEAGGLGKATSSSCGTRRSPSPQEEGAPPESQIHSEVSSLSRGVFPSPPIASGFGQARTHLHASVSLDLTASDIFTITTWR